MNIVIRTATFDDHEAIARVARELNVMHARALPDRFRVTPDAFPAAYFRSLLESPEVAILLAGRDGDVLGHAILQVKEAVSIPVAAPRRFAFLSDLVVAEAERRRGIGRLLMDAAVVWAREQGASSLELGVFEFNAGAIAFYERYGFASSKRTMSLRIENT